MQTIPYLPAAAPIPAERRSPRPQPARRARTRGHTRRRRVAAVAAQPLLQRWWDEHAVKAGLLAFYGWFAVANYSRLQHAAADGAGWLAHAFG